MVKKGGNEGHSIRLTRLEDGHNRVWHVPFRILLTQRANDSDWSVGGRKHDGLNLNS